MDVCGEPSRDCSHTTTSIHPPRISASWKPASNFSEPLEFWRGFYYWERVRCHFLHKKKKCHKKGTWTAQVASSSQKCARSWQAPKRGTGFVFGFAQTEAFGECLNHWIRLLSWHTALSSSVNLPAAIEIFVQGSQGSGRISPLSHPSVISPGKMVCIASILERHIERRYEGHQICC